MRITKAVITAAKPSQRSLPLQLLVDRDEDQKPALRIIIEEALSAGVQEVCLVIHPGDRGRYEDALGPNAPQAVFVEQKEPRGYGHALSCARDFVEGDFFLHLVSDHIFVARGRESCAEQIVKIAEASNAAVSAVQPTHERYLDRYGVVKGGRLEDSRPLYKVERVREKPTLEIAEKELVTEGLRPQHFLCFFGMHVFPPAIMDMLDRAIVVQTNAEKQHMPAALDELARTWDYIAVEPRGFRCNMGVSFGLLRAQIALVHAGPKANKVLTEILGVLIEGAHD